MEGRDLTELGGTDEAIMISTKTGYCRLKKVPYYEDKHFSRLFKEACNIY